VLHVHIDVDNLWILEDAYGVGAAAADDAIFEDALPRFLSLFETRGIRATFFVVGRDLALPSCRRFCEAAALAGHELANHTESHLNDLAQKPFAEKDREITLPHAAISQLCGIAPIGFRAPGYYIDDEILLVLERLGYRYESSVLPGPACFLMNRYLKGKSAARKTFGRGRYLLAPRRPRLLRARTPEQHASIVELPISVDPLTRLPIHSTFAYKFGAGMVVRALDGLRRAPGPHVYLFHAVDLLDYPAHGPLAQSVIPLQHSLAERLALVQTLLDAIVSRFRVVTTREFLAEGDAMQRFGSSASRFYDRLRPIRSR
jgi:peptidoglycan/xylan/chitin deacetylase (PgdA/CDA1 family)